MTDTLPRTSKTADPAASMAAIQVRLGDLGVAKENLRHDEPADEGLPQLADTILAAGLIVPLIVRAGRQGEPRHVTLDGRRRRLALLLLKQRGLIDDDYVVDCKLAATRSQRAAAILLPNTEHAPVHVADVIAAIGRLRRARMDTAAIAKALGYAELEIRRFDALSSVHVDALNALRQGKLTLKQVRLIARIADKARQAEVAQTALDGYFHEYQLRQIVEGARLTIEDPRLVLVGMDRYAAAGGRISVDLFGELPDALLDAHVLQDAWRARVQPIVDQLKAEGLAVYIGTDGAFETPDGFARLPYVHRNDLSAAQAAALDDARERLGSLATELDGADPRSDGAPAAFGRLASAMAAVAGASLNSCRIGAAMLSPTADDHGFAVTFYAVPQPATALAHDVIDVEANDGTADRRGLAVVDVPRAEVDVQGASHVLHAKRTDVATRRLMRDLADHPGAALSVLTAQLFKQLALQACGSLEDSALQLSAKRYSVTAPIAALDGEVKARLDVRREAYRTSGLRPIPWVESLPHEEKMALLAELAAISLNLREERTTSIRDAARAEAGEIAALCGADISAHWTPDTGYLAAHSKAQLLALLDEMGVTDERAKSLKKEALVAFVAETAAARAFAPAVLAWNCGSLVATASEAAGDAGTERVAAEPQPGPDAASLPA